MPNRKDEKNNKKKGSLDNVKTVAGVALAVGAGATFLMRTVGGKNISNGADIAKSALSGIKKDFSRTALKDKNFEFMKNTIKNNINNSKGIKDRAIKAQRNSKDNLLNAFAEASRIKENKSGFLKAKFEHETMIDLEKELTAKFARDNTDKQGHIRDIIREGYANIGKLVDMETNEAIEYNQKFITKHLKEEKFDLSEQVQIVESILEKSKNKNRDFIEFEKANESLVENVSKQLTDYDTLATKFGTKKNKDAYEYGIKDRQLTVNDLLNNRKKFEDFKINSSKNNDIDIIELLKDKVEQDSRYGELNIDSLLRINNKKEVYSLGGIKDTANRIEKEFADTIVGKLAKAREMNYPKNAPIMTHHGKGTTHPLLSSLVEKSGRNLIDNEYFTILDRTYKNVNNELELIKDSDKFYRTSGKHGSAAHLMKRILGDTDRISYKETNFLDIGSNTSPTKVQELKSVLSKFKDPDWEPNLLKRFKESEPLTEKHLEDNEYIIEKYKDIKKLNNAFRISTNNVNNETIESLKNNSNPVTKRILEMLEFESEEILQRLGEKRKGEFHNIDLGSLVNSYKKDPKKVLDRLQISNDGGVVMSTTKGLGINEILKKEIIKEAILTESAANNNSLNAITNYIEFAGIKGQEAKELKHLASWAVFQKETGLVAGDYQINQKENMIEAIKSAELLFKSDTELDTLNDSKDMLNVIRENTEEIFKERFSSFSKGTVVDVDQLDKGADYGDYMLMRKAITPLEAINDATKRKGFVKQFTAGRNNPEDITTATLLPFFAVNRLVTPLDAVGLGFSDENTKDVINLASSIMLKRVAPIIAGVTTLSYLNYESKNLTGTSLKGAAANSIANTDLAIRGIADTLGLTEKLKDNREINPMAQYLFGEEYQDKEERQDWYENGYSEVRKGRYWAFGSTSEFRGGKIDYFQPNYLKRAHSDWFDIGTYGSSKDKWKHSLIPTIRHPFSTLNYIADPYWLEDKMYDERPYPMTGKMFGQGTPWSAPLNATIGNLIKPQKRMHEEHLGDSFTDVRGLIEERNKRIIKKAQDNSVIEVGSDGSFTPGTYTPLRPNHTQTMNIQIKDGEIKTKIINYQHTPGLEINEYSELRQDNSNIMREVINDDGEYINTNQSDNYNNYQDYNNDQSIGLLSSLFGGEKESSGDISFSNKLKVKGRNNELIGAIIGSSKRDTISLSNIARENRKIINEGSQKKQGIITPDVIFNKQARYGGELLHHPETLSDLRNLSELEDDIRDITYSAKQLGGMYGFLFDQVIDSERGIRLQSSDRMTEGFGRKFWDASIGGSGGEFMEIARRFFPHENHDVEQFNPIRNSMPDWMPERMRFGDPFEKFPKGEMRLPGRGYEDIHELHPDEYGEYGAFDRMKILADIAPWSNEYKTWRGIANETVYDPELRNEMKEIKSRVIDQSKNHDFYPYKFKGESLDYKEGIIEEVISGNSFRMMGDDRTYSLASISSIDKEVEPGGINSYLQPGLNIRIGIDSNEYNHQGNISSVVYVDGENLNKKLIDSGIAKEKKDDSIAGANATLSQSQIDRGKIYETIAHAKIPFIHNKFMRVNSPLESYKDEQIYGTSFATWDHPIEGFIMPAIKQAGAATAGMQTVGIASWLLAEKLSKTDLPSGVKTTANIMWGITNPGAVAGATVGVLSKLSLKNNLVKDSARIGTILGIGNYALNSLNDPVKATYSFGMLGALAGKQLFNETKLGAIVGAGIGLLASSNKVNLLDKDYKKDYIPNDVKKRWEIEEYYDRLKYIKYTGLFEEAARKAKKKEGVDIKNLIKVIDSDKKRNDKIKANILDYQEEVKKSYAENDYEGQKLIEESTYKLALLSEPSAVVKGGEYTKSALVYKQAAESTIYGLKENASWSQLLRALPKNERDYMLEFSKEADPKKREEILRLVSPYQRKVLDIAWNNKVKTVESNAKFFRNHKLPGGFWSGWNPSEDLENVKIKTIKNEGLMLSDFGVYESQLEDPEYKTSPSIEEFNNQSHPIELVKNLTTSLNGLGLSNINVSVEPSNEKGIQMFTNITRMAGYEVKKKISNTLGIPFYN